MVRLQGVCFLFDSHVMDVREPAGDLVLSETQCQTFAFCCLPQCQTFNLSLFLTVCCVIFVVPCWVKHHLCSGEEDHKRFSLSIHLDRIQLLSNLHSQRIRTPESLSIFTHRLLSDAYWMCLSPCSESYNSSIRIHFTHCCALYAVQLTEDQLTYPWSFILGSKVVLLLWNGPFFA